MQKNKTEEFDILIIEDDPITAELFRSIICDMGHRVKWANSGNSGIECLKNCQPKLILLDYSLPDMNAEDLIETIKKNFLRAMPPFIMITGAGDEKIAVDMMKRGARDYLIKNPFLFDQLPSAISIVLQGIETEHKLVRAELALRESEQNFRAILSNISDVAWLKDLEGRYIVVNDTFSRLHNIKPSDVVGKTDLELWPTEFAQSYRRDDAEVISAGKEKKVEEFIVTENGQRFLETIKRPIIDSYGEIVGTVGIGRDVTERKENEIKINSYVDELKRLGHTRDKIFSIIANDLKNPFAGILSTSGILKDNFDKYSKETIKKFAEMINESAKNVFLQAENLFQWSLLQTNKLEFIPEKIILNEIMAQVLPLFKTYADNKNIVITIDVDGAVVFADRHMLTGILGNLISNAVKFTNENGEIKIKSTVKGDFTEISITDSGTGICENDLKKLFKMDVYVDETGPGVKGTGLGLVLCKEFVEKNKGEIRAESKPGAGSVFTFTIPSANIAFS